MEPARILVSMGNDSALNKLKTVLTGSGYQVIDQAKDGSEALRKMIYLKPDLAVLDYGLPPQNGFEIAKIAVEDSLCDIILIINNEQKDSIENIKSEYDIITVTKPLNRESFIGTIELLVKSRRKIIKLEKEIETLRKTIDTRKEIEKAKGLLMEQLNLTEEQAFRMIQKQSMDRRVQMSEIAKAIILAYDLKK